MNSSTLSTFFPPWAKTAALLLLYFMIAVATNGLSQTNQSDTTFNRKNRSVEYLNDFFGDKMYLTNPAPERKELAHILISDDFKKHDSDSLMSRKIDSIYTYCSTNDENESIRTETGISWKKSLNINKSASDFLKGDYWVRINNLKDWEAFLKNEPRISTISTYGEYVKIHIQNVKLEFLLNREYLTYIEKASNSIKSEAQVRDLNLHPNRINTIHAYLPIADGQGELVSIREPIYDIEDIDISGRYKDSGRESEFSDQHPLDMATIIGGNGNSFVTGLGVAPEVYHTSSSNKEVTPDPDDYFGTYGIQTQNHSYGTEIESFYGVAAALYDKQVYENPEILHVFSIGNSGLEASDHGKYEGIAGFSNLTGNFKQAKNVLTVGAVDTSLNTIELNSNGPAFEGRIKPEIVAYSMTGTSNSAALVSGVSVLLQQSYRAKFSEDMSASLTKAFLINSADNIGELGPEHKTGFGSLNGYEALKLLQEDHFFEDEIISDEKTYQIKVPENAVNLKATLVWTDPPANPNDQTALKHDLNLSIKVDNEGIHLPWVLSTEANDNTLLAPSTKGIDHLNNIEQVHIQKINTDSVEIKIALENPIPFPQSFSLVFGWEIENQFSWTSPTFKDNIPYDGETASHLRWESSYPATASGDLYFKLYSQNSWQLIKENIRLNKENFRWDPEIVNDFAQLKMQIGETSYLSDTFSISQPLRLNVGFNCSDSLSFYWDAIPDSDYFTLFNYEDHKMQPLLSTQDTSITINKSELGSSFLKLQAFKYGKPLISGAAIDYRLQGANCFVESYYVEAVQGEGIIHTLQLSSISGVDKISFEKKNNLDNSWEKLSESNANSFNTEYLEAEPNNGFNISRAVIHFSNGEKLSSEIQSAYYVNDSDFIVYPNPISKDEELKVFAKEVVPEASIAFYNLQGQKLFSSTIPNDRNFLALDFLKPGIYFYKISDKGKNIASGKILMRK